MATKLTLSQINKRIEGGEVLFELKGDSTTCYTPTAVEVHLATGKLLVVSKTMTVDLENCKLFVLGASGWETVSLTQ